MGASSASSSFIIHTSSFHECQVAQGGLTYADVLIVPVAQRPLGFDGQGDTGRDTRRGQRAVNARGQCFIVQFAGGTLGPAFITDLHQAAVFCAVRRAPIMFPTELTK
jgi:hypothetical protein